MKEEQKIYIRGSKDRPNDVRRILEQHGGKVNGVTNFTYNSCIYYINHDSIIDYTSEGSELYRMITEYYLEVKLPNSSECWEKGDILVSNNDADRFFVFESFTKDGRIFVYLEINKSPIDDKALRINDVYHLVSYTQCHKADNKELKIFYNQLAIRNFTWDPYNKELLHGDYTYFYPKNGHYYFRRNTLRCKDRTTDEWYDAVLYSDTNKQYVRELNDFNTKFRKV